MLHKKDLQLRDSPGISVKSTASIAGWTSKVGSGVLGSISSPTSSPATGPMPGSPGLLGMPNPNPRRAEFGNLPRLGEGEGAPEPSPEEVEVVADIGIHGAGDSGGVEADVTKDVGERRERSPEEKDEERPCVGLRLCCGAGCGWLSDEVMSIRPPPTTPFFRSVERMEFRV